MSDNELRFPDDRPDREIGDALRPLLAVPPGVSWEDLHRRVMARVEAERSSPWNVLAGWTRPAAVAAAVLLAGASLLLTRLHEQESAVAYGAVTEEQYPVAASAPPASENAATIHLLLDR